MPSEQALSLPGPSAVEGLEVELDCDLSSGKQGYVSWKSWSGSRPLFYRVVKANPSRSKILQLAPGISHLTASQQIVQVHWQLFHSQLWRERQEVLVAIDPVQAGDLSTSGFSFCLDTDRVGDDMLLSEWCCWDACPQHAFVLLDSWDGNRLQNEDLCEIAPLDVLSESMAVVQKMVEAQAFCGTGQTYTIGSLGSSAIDDAQRTYLQHLKAQGSVVNTDAEQEMQWQFTDLGAQRIRCCLVLKNRRGVAQARPLPSQGGDQSLFELVSALESDGWILKQEPVKRSATRLLTLKDALEPGPHEAKTIFFDKSISKKYLLALANMEPLHRVGVNEIIHGQAAGYYAQFFDDEGNPRKPAARHMAAQARPILDVDMELAELKVDGLENQQKKRRTKVEPKLPQAAGALENIVTPTSAAALRAFLPPLCGTSGVIAQQSIEAGENEYLSLEDERVLPSRQPPPDMSEQSAPCNDGAEASQAREPFARPSEPDPQDTVFSVGNLGMEVEEPTGAADSSSRPVPPRVGVPDDLPLSSLVEELEIVECERPKPSPHPSGPAHPRRAAADVLGFFYECPITRQSHKFTHKASNNSWQVRCSYHEPKINPSGSKTHCTRTMPIKAGEDKDFVIAELKNWIGSAPEYADKAAHQKMPFRCGGAGAKAKAKGSAETQAKPKIAKGKACAKPSEAEAGSSSSSSSSSSSGSSSTESSSSQSSSEE